MMTWKFIILMMDLTILILVKVQSNDLASNTFHPPLLPILLPHHFKLDNVKKLFSICIEENVEKCIRK